MTEVSVESVSDDLVEIAPLLFSPAHKARALERQYQCRLLRDIMGNPFRPVSLSRWALEWNDAALVKLARGIYERDCFGELPLLADALEGAGCAECDVLRHCRGEQQHVRGCWVIDLVLGKE
jgi:hypothetical protein